MDTYPSPGDFGPVGSVPAARPARRPALVLRGRFPWRRLVLPLVVLAVVAGLASGTGYRYTEVKPGTLALTISPPDAGDKKAVRKLQSTNKQLTGKLGQARPRGTYLVVDQTHNRLYVKKDDAVVRTAVCSAGSGMVLREGEAGRKWVFDTPRGLYKVRNRVANPIWKKPDWAFVEEGKPIPKNPQERFESGTLGEYALYLGDGYMIHGTLYTRLLGRNVTHGCIRLGKDDLRAVWAAAPIGTPVYIY
jgi:L,D-transpeptidase ErfK/SrfK